jgi:Secretion system C-terminal sorting domain
MRRHAIVLCAIFLALLLGIPNGNAANITIIESQSANAGHNMDSSWQTAALGMGHSVALVPQTTLDNNSFFATTDVLIVSSGVITLPNNRRDMISAFMQTGKPAYLQAEYQLTYTTTQAFASIVSSLGGTFSWSGESTGTLAPMVPLGSLGTTPNAIGSLAYYWYGVYGSGTTGMTSDLTYNNLIYGFTFDPPNSSYGLLCCNTDQDWARVGQNVNNIDLMENYLTRMLNDVTGSLILTFMPQVTSIPSSGGTLWFQAQVSNNLGYNWTGDGWTDLILPNGNYYGPLVVFNGLSFANGTTTPWIQLSQNVPAFAPPGQYVFFGNLGTLNPFTLDGQDSFAFMKTIIPAASDPVNDWEGDEWSALMSDEEDETVSSPLPESFIVSDAYPNPFNPSTTIEVGLSETAILDVTVYDVQGREVAKLAQGTHNAGTHQFSFDAHSLSSGVYFLQARVGGEVQTRKLILMQ